MAQDSGLPTFRIRPVSEEDIDKVVVRAGGKRAHPDFDRRTKRGADFLLGQAAIELKILEDEGLSKPERQRKVAGLFREQFPNRPTVVLDPEQLDDDRRRSYFRMMEGPVKSAVASARRQLAQTREEHGTRVNLLWIVNNGYSSLTHDVLCQVVGHRARQDSSEIDAVIVSGAYHFSDTFDSEFFWPIDFVAIHVDRSFAEFDVLQDSWNTFAGARMTALLMSPPTDAETKGPLVDVAFQHEDVWYVFPTPPMGKPSQFFVNGRPRRNSTGIESCPPVATVFATLSLSEWETFRTHEPGMVSEDSFRDWMGREQRARSESRLLPVGMRVTYRAWKSWMQGLADGSLCSIDHFATELFEQAVRSVMLRAREYKEGCVEPSRYLLLITEEIGQDLAFDVSHLAEVAPKLGQVEALHEVWVDRRMFFQHALACAAAEAVARGLDYVLWCKDQRYAWQ